MLRKILKYKFQFDLKKKNYPSFFLINLNLVNLILVIILTGIYFFKQLIYLNNLNA